jgi:hypothetical protein
MTADGDLKIIQSLNDRLKPATVVRLADCNFILHTCYIAIR